METKRAYWRSESAKANKRRYRKSKAYRIKRRTSDRRVHLRRKRGITLKAFDKMSAAQNGRCAICEAVPKARLHVDHDHQTDRIRALLCGHCNVMLGFARDNILTLYRAADYLELHRRKA